MNKLLIITGSTATGKTSLGIELAKKFNGEIISADSRQVYKFMDIGTGKDKNEYTKNGIKVWGIDLVNPDYSFNISDFINYTTEKIMDIQNRNKLPIVVGGTALYIKAILEPIETINVPPNNELRNKLAKYAVEELQQELKKIDFDKWKKMNNSDQNNPRRLARAIEVAYSRHSGGELARTPECLSLNRKTIPDSVRITKDVLLISLKSPYDLLYSHIDQRVDDRIKQGAIEEIQKLLKMGYSFDLPSMTASGYKEFAMCQLQIINNQLTNEQITEISKRWKLNEHAYAKRQTTFINKLIKEQREKGRNPKEFDIQDPSFLSEVSEEVEQWYSRVDDPKEN